MNLFEVNGDAPPRFGDMLSAAFTFVFFAWLAVSLMRSRRKSKPVGDDPAGRPYKIYTREFDRVVPADNLNTELMGMSLDFANGHFDLSKEAWNQKVGMAEAMAADDSTFDSVVTELAASGDMANCAILILVDQSGSMKGEKMVWTAAGVRQLSEMVAVLGTAVEIAGYTTAGWRGGFARQKWLVADQPERPGRLCATLHVIYKAFDEPRLRVDAWRQMLNPNLLRENVDGEALEWAEHRLCARPEKRRVLLVLSEGAPVDDSTLLENGPSYMIHHLNQVIGRLERSAELELLALGLGYDLEDYYERWARADSRDDIVKQSFHLLTSRSTS